MECLCCGDVFETKCATMSSVLIWMATKMETCNPLWVNWKLVLKNVGPIEFCSNLHLIVSCWVLMFDIKKLNFMNNSKKGSQNEEGANTYKNILLNII
jgi:hypothetical protein